MVATVPVETPSASACPKCGKELPAGAKKCPEHRNWIGWLKQVPDAVKYLVTTTAGVIGIVVVILNWHSRTVVTSLGNADEATLLVVVTNEGKGTSSVRLAFRLVAAQPDVIEFGALTLVSPDEERAIAAGKSAYLRFDISNIRPAHDVRSDAFWTQYGDMPVRFEGRVEESNGKVRELKKSVPLSELKRFVQLRTVPPRETR
jgi:hypothetical protein